ncbi:hypothetical protein ACS0TY_013730 [Phlomoides rotata]
MARLQVNRDSAEEWDSVICPMIMETLRKNMKQAVERIPLKSDDCVEAYKRAYSHPIFGIMGSDFWPE